MASTIFDAVGGMPALVALAHAWHERCLADPVVAHAFSHGYHPDHSQRLAAYWAEALGGPADYSGSVAGESEVVRLHSGNGPHPDMDARAVACFERAVADVGLAADTDVRDALVAYFRWATDRLGTFHDSAADVPDGLPVPRWSWGGLVEGSDGLAGGAGQPQ